MRKNLDIRIEALKADLFLSTIADHLNISRNDFYSRLRAKELKQSEKDHIYAAIQEISEQRRCRHGN